ncbi:MAG: hypothetical protein D6767_01710 [Candidatus Hydrogenedentota bacterium]|nr:MAG: hypothetical protein D6767_01710 [Candidatus Hydrogenedentota bacterium]
MARKYHPLKSRKAIQLVFNKGISLKSKNFAVKFLPSEKKGIYAVWAIPRNVKKAVFRNRLKRQGRATLDAVLQEYPQYLELNLYIAFVLFPSFEKMAFAEKKKYFAKVLEDITKNLT